jgi:small subunit ribosomal protein S15
LKGSIWLSPGEDTRKGHRKGFKWLLTLLFQDWKSVCFSKSGESMARLYSKKRGKHSSKKPIRSSKPSWVKIKNSEIEKIIIDMAKQGKGSSQIGTTLRDSYGVPDVKLSLKKSITDVMKENKVYPQLPEDMLNLIKRAVMVRKHLEKNKMDLHSKRGLQLIESKIKRLGKYYIRMKKVPSDWRYDPEKAKLLVE